ncbi:MAG: NAD(P)/FAD-dependent oxidoreductase [Betaproteobacteria bacterium]|nr:NAD(P)/FAD-dependent oxidoreductase [Betaproteobacteria bacterium]
MNPISDPNLPPQGLEALNARIARDLDLIKYPEPRWMPVRTAPDGSRALDVLIVGAGQCGQAVATQLLRERVDNIALIDSAARGREGPWNTFARMQTLRTWKTVTGPDLALPSLTFQSWFEAQFGAERFANLNKIPKEQWHEYLLWVRDVLRLPVTNGVRLESLEPLGDLIAASVRHADGTQSSLFARKVVLAMGIASSGRWWMPEQVAALPARWRAHTAEEIDFQALRGRRVAVLGAGASAFDNAAAALEAGASQVSLFCRREQLQRIQPYKAISFPGFLRHLGSADDATRWSFMNHLLSVREALPVETWNRVTRHRNFELHTGSPWESLAVEAGCVRIQTPRGLHEADFVIAGTGFDLDVRTRPELGRWANEIATWADRYVPPAGHENERLSRYPYLGPGQQLQSRVAGRAPFLSQIHLMDFGATVSFGPSGSSINAMKFAVPRVVDAITRDLFLADIDQHFANLLAYDTPEFPTTFARDS